MMKMIRLVALFCANPRCMLGLHKWEYELGLGYKECRHCDKRVE